MTFFSTSCVSSSEISRPVSDAYAISRISDPSSSRMFDLIRPAMYIATLSGSGTASASAFRLRIATWVSISGGWMSAIKSPFEPRSQPFLERRNFMRRMVAAEDDLLLRVVQRVERVEELGLRAFLARDELDVVDEQDVDRSIALAEIEDAIVAKRVDHLVHESLGRDVGELRIDGSCCSTYCPMACIRCVLPSPTPP